MARKQVGAEKEEKKTKQLTLRIPDDLHRKLKVKCVIEGKTMGEVLMQAIREYVETE